MAASGVRMIVMARLITIGALGAALTLSGCGSSATAKGELMGQTPLCTAYAETHQSTVYVSKNGQLVATRDFPTGGATYSLTLPAGRYSVRYALAESSVPSYSVVVRAMGIAHVPRLLCL